MLNQKHQGHIEANRRMKDNTVKTSQYNMLNFIPKNILFIQLRKAPNIYFLAIAYLQTVDKISITAGKPVIAFPLFIVTTISMIKDAFEDYKRHQSDAQENTRQCEVYNPYKKLFEKRPWSQVRVGEIVKVKSEEYVPADLLILSTSDSKGVCYVETKNLDGETNLKIKNSNKELNQAYGKVESFGELNGQILCERPNAAIYKFEGSADVKISGSMQKITLNADNILLRGSSVRNTEYVYGVTLFTGHCTKIMKNSANSKYKFSKLERLTNFSILIIFCTQIVLALIGALIGADWTINGSKFHYYLFEDTKNHGWIDTIIK